MPFQCKSCGEVHDELPHVGADAPHYYEEQKGSRLTSDLCVIDGDYFIRGVLAIPVHGEEDEEAFGFGVWVSQKKENFELYEAHFESADIGPFFGWLSTELRCYAPSTLNLKTRAHFRGEGLRPLIELQPSDHPLSVDQQNGVSLARAWELVHLLTDPLQ